MNRRQLSDRIGNIDDQLVEEAQYRQHKKTGGFRRFLAVAAAAALMAASFTVGALAFSREVPVEQETIEIPDIGLTLILPDSWKGSYDVEMDGNEAGCSVYVKSIHDAGELEGRLFWVGKSFPEPMTPEELEEAAFVPCRYLFSTAEGTYSLNYASDVQWDPEDPKQEEIYLKMQAEVGQIRFVVDNILSE